MDSVDFEEMKAGFHTHAEAGRPDDAIAVLRPMTERHPQDTIELLDEAVREAQAAALKASIKLGAVAKGSPTDEVAGEAQAAALKASTKLAAVAAAYMHIKTSIDSSDSSTPGEPLQEQAKTAEQDSQDAQDGGNVPATSPKSSKSGVGQEKSFKEGADDGAEDPTVGSDVEGEYKGSKKLGLKELLNVAKVPNFPETGGKYPLGKAYVFECDICRKTYRSKYDFARHMRDEHKRYEEIPEDHVHYDEKHSWGGFVLTAVSEDKKTWTARRSPIRNTDRFFGVMVKQAMKNATTKPTSTKSTSAKPTSTNPTSGKPTVQAKPTVQSKAPFQSKPITSSKPTVSSKPTAFSKPTASSKPPASSKPGKKPAKPLGALTGAIQKATPIGAASQAETKKPLVTQTKAPKAANTTKATGGDEVKQSFVNTTTANRAVDTSSQQQPAAVAAEYDDDSEINMAESVSEDDSIFRDQSDAEDDAAEDQDEDDDDKDEAGDVLHNKYSMKLPK